MFHRKRLPFKTIALVMAAWMAATPPALAAFSVSQAFSGLLQASSASGPGYYHTATRGIFVGGSLRVWTPTQSVQFVSLTPPSLEAGCGGISMFFGGFSFINGAQFAALVKNLMQVAEGMAIELGIRALCPMCADVLAEMHNIANKMNALTQDNCAVAKGLLTKAANHLGVPTSFKAGKNLCAQSGAASGLYKDYLSGIDNACSTVSGALSQIMPNLEKAAQATGLSKAYADITASTKAAPVLGNQNWILLTQAGYADTDVKELLLSIVGDQVKYKDGKPYNYAGWIGVKGVNDGQGLGAKVAARQLLELMLFGPDPISSISYLKQALGGKLSNNGALQTLFVQAFNDAQSAAFAKRPILTCDIDSLGHAAPAFTPYSGLGGGRAALTACDYPKTVPVKDTTNPLLYGNGLLANVAILLNSAVYSVSTDQPIPTKAIELMQVVPLPIYQMVNVAAVYPAAAAQLIHNYSTFIAILIAQSILRQWMEVPSTVVSDSPDDNINAVQTMQAVAAQIGALADSAKGTIGVALGTQDKILASLQTINNVIYQQMSGSGLQGNLLFTQGLAAGITVGH
jgi:hypothetical protein